MLAHTLRLLVCCLSCRLAGVLPDNLCQEGGACRCAVTCFTAYGVATQQPFAAPPRRSTPARNRCNSQTPEARTGRWMVGQLSQQQAGDHQTSPHGHCPSAAAKTKLATCPTICNTLSACSVDLAVVPPLLCCCCCCSGQQAAAAQHPRQQSGGQCTSARELPQPGAAGKAALQAISRERSQAMWPCVLWHVLR
jgi:hypothetical protein